MYFPKLRALMIFKLQFILIYLPNNINYPLPFYNL